MKRCKVGWVCASAQPMVGCIDLCVPAPQGAVVRAGARKLTNADAESRSAPQIFWAGPMSGAVLAALMYEVLLRPSGVLVRAAPGALHCIFCCGRSLHVLQVEL